MMDIVSVEDSTDLGLYISQTPRAANILGVQLGSLEYEPDLGIDLRYFLTEEIQFQTDSFKAYLIQVLARNSINVTVVTEVLESLVSDININLAPEETSSGFVAR